MIAYKNLYLRGLFTKLMLAGLLVLVISSYVLADTARYDHLLERLQTSPRSVEETEVVELLRLARSEGRPYPVSLAVAQYMAQQRQASPTLLALAAEVAVLAGDLRTAVSRYKSCLSIVRPSEAAANISADLYELLIFILADEDDAYRTMTDEGAGFRGSLRARQFDQWYLGVAREMVDYANHIRMLQLVMEEKMPIEEERTHFWAHLDWLIAQMSTPRDNRRDVVADFEQIIPLIRDDEYRTAYAGFVAANLRFHTDSHDDDEARERAFNRVLQAARKAFDTRPELETYQNIVVVFGGGPDGFHHNNFRNMTRQKASLLEYVFPRLGDDERRELLWWSHNRRDMVEHIGTGEAWTAAAVASDGWFAGKRLPEDISFRVGEDSLDAYRRAARGLNGVLHRDAAVINALSRGGTAKEAVDYLMENETWHMSFDGLTAAIHGPLWRGWCALNGKDHNENREARDELMEYFLNRYLVRSPAALFDKNGVRDSLYAAWRSYVANEDRLPLQMIDTLKNLNWVPYSERDRKEVIGSAFSEFNRWARDVRRNRQDNEAAMSAANRIETAFNEAMELKTPAIDSVNNQLARRVAQLHAARQSGDEAAVRAQSMSLFNAMKNAASSKRDFGLAILGYVARSGENFDGFAMHMEMLKELLAAYDAEGENIETRRFVDNMMDARNWRFWNITRDEQERSLEMCDAFGAALMRMMDENKFCLQVLGWMRGTHQGREWHDRNRRADVVERIIREKERGLNRMLDEQVSALLLMHIVRRNITDMQSDYHHETYFDDLFVRDSRRIGYFSWDYWDDGRDRNNKVVNAAAREFAKYDRLPVGYGNSPRVYSRRDFDRWQQRVLQAERGPLTEMLDAIEGRYGSTRFDETAMGVGRLNSMRVTNANRSDYFRRLGEYINKGSKARVRMEPPSMSPLRDLLGDVTFSDSELELIGKVLTDISPVSWSRNEWYEASVRAVQDGWLDKDKPVKLLPLVREFWRVSRDTNNSELQRDLATRARRFLESGNQDMASAYALSATDIIGGRMEEDVRAAIQSVRTRAVARMSRVIPVDRGDPRYPAFEAQMAYLTGRSENAWDLYEPRMGLFRDMFRELDPQFCIWLIRRHTELGEFDDAEALARPMILWMDENPSGFDPEVRAALSVAYADISFRRQEYPRARAQYERIAANDDYSGTRSQRVAELRVAEVDRLTRNYSRAESILDNLIRRRDPFLQAEGNLLMSRLMYDQEHYEEAMVFLENVFAINPNHADARIMQGELFLRLKRLVEATDVRVGLSTEQQVLVPGRPLRISIEDPNLAVVGQSANIEITVRTTAGDEETFTLLPFGDTRTRFEGQVMTKLGAPVPGDGVLQVLGSDEITYDFSERFKAERGRSRDR